MLRLLQWLFLGHVHKWVDVDTQNMIAQADKHWCGRLVFQRCERCGKRQTYRFDL